MVTKRRIMQGGAGVLGALLLYGIWRDFRSDPLAGRAEHEAGFSVVVPEGFEVRRSAGKLKITNFDHNRSKWIEVYETDPQTSSRRYAIHVGPTRQTRAGRVQYTLRESKETKGTWELKAGLAYGPHRVFFHAVEAGTPEQPDFAFAWQVIGSLRT